MLPPVLSQPTYESNLYIVMYMDEKKGNLSFSLQEISKENQEEVTYADLLKEVDYMEMCSTVVMDDYIAQEVEYDTNYTKKELDKIAEYYEISKSIDSK